MDQRESLEGNLKTHGELNKLHIELNKYKVSKFRGHSYISVKREVDAKCAHYKGGNVLFQQPNFPLQDARKIRAK